MRIAGDRSVSPVGGVLTDHWFPFRQSDTIRLPFFFFVFFHEQ